MLIWTTHQLKDLLVEDFRVRIESSDSITDLMLKEAGISDGALIPLEEGYRDFLAKIRSKGVTGPIILIVEKGPRPPDEFLYPLNALCFSLEEDDIVKMGIFINFIFRLALLSAIPDIKPSAQITFSSSISDRPIDDPQKIRDIINYVVEKEIPIIISFEINEYGRPVSVRGVCRIRQKGDFLILYQFKPLVLIKGIKEGAEIKAVLSYKELNYETIIKIIKVSEHDAESLLPERLFIERRRHVRIAPSVKKPVGLFLLMPGEATLSLECFDISQQGVGFFSERELKQGEVYVFSIQLPEERKVIMSYGIIRFKKETGQKIRYGAELYIHPQDEELIVQYIRKRGVEIIDILRQL
jgi:hypothetical protein